MSKRQRREAENAILAEPGTLDAICAFIADRGTLTAWCRSIDYKVRYQRVYDWIHDDPERLKKYARALEVRQHALGDTVIDGMREGAEADVRRLYDEDGNPLPGHRLPDSLARVVNKVKIVRKTDEDGGETETIEYGLDSRVASREQLGKHLGMFKDNVQLGGKLEVQDATPEETARKIAFALAAALRKKPEQRKQA